MTESEKYINPFTDFGFKKLFGEEPNKDLLIDFLNELLPEETSIKELSYIKNEQIGSSDTDRRAVFDLYCENESGEKFIVELQKAKQDFFKDRSVFYSTFPIREQSKRGEWNFELKAVYTIGILDFVFESDSQEQDKILYKVKLADIETCKIFYDKLTYMYLEMPKFNKKETELVTKFDKWLFLIRNLSKLHNRPEALQEKVFQKVFEIAEIAKFDERTRLAYEESKKHYLDFMNSINTAIGSARKDEKLEMAIRMLKKGYPDKEILDLTEISIEELENAKKA